jgi:hypothetical protein
MATLVLLDFRLAACVDDVKLYFVTLSTHATGLQAFALRLGNQPPLAVHLSLLFEEESKTTPTVVSMTLVWTLWIAATLFVSVARDQLFNVGRLVAFDAQGSSRHRVVGDSGAAQVGPAASAQKTSQSPTEPHLLSTSIKLANQDPWGGFVVANSLVAEGGGRPLCGDR